MGRSLSKFKARVIALDVITADNKAELFPLADAVLQDLDALNNQAVFFHDEKARADFAGGVALARRGIVAIKTGLALVKRPVKARGLPLDKLDAPARRAALVPSPKGVSV